MLKITTLLASLLLSSLALADDGPSPAPYPEGAPPQNASANNPGGTTDRLGSKPADAQNAKDSQATGDEAKTRDNMKNQGDDE